MTHESTVLVPTRPFATQHRENSQLQTFISNPAFRAKFRTMDDLESNPLYRAFLGEFRREFEIACQMSCLIAIPLSETLEDVMIDQFFANSHILMPSKLLKM